MRDSPMTEAQEDGEDKEDDEDDDGEEDDRGEEDDSSDDDDDDENASDAALAAAQQRLAEAPAELAAHVELVRVLNQGARRPSWTRCARRASRWRSAYFRDHCFA